MTDGAIALEVWDAVSGGNHIQSITLQQSGGAPTNRITSVTSGSTVNYSYDATGTVTNDGVHSHSYDAENRLVSVDGGATAQYKYDHQNRRVTKIVGSAWTHYIWEGAQVIAEHDATTAYSRNPTYQEKSARLDHIYSGARMISSRQRTSSTGPWTTRWFLNDRLSVRMTLDNSGNVLGRQAHLPFGEDFGESGTQEKHQFTSYERDSESGLDYAINRGYSAAAGRFFSVDRIAGNVARPQRLNRYAYTRNDPVNNTDRLGLEGCPAGTTLDPESDECVWLGVPEEPIVLHGEGEYPDEGGPLGCNGDPWCSEWAWAGPTVLLDSPGPTTFSETCNVIIPIDPGERDAVAVVLGEATPLHRFGNRTYQDGDRRNGPTGSHFLAGSDFQLEALLIVSVIANRANDPGKRFGGSTWHSVINRRGAFAGLREGRRRLAAYQMSDEGSPECDQLKRAVSAVAIVKLKGAFGSFLWFVAVIQENRARRRRPGDFRFADTDFSTEEF